MEDDGESDDAANSAGTDAKGEQEQDDLGDDSAGSESSAGSSSNGDPTTPLTVESGDEKGDTAVSFSKGGPPTPPPPPHPNSDRPLDPTVCPSHPVLYSCTPGRPLGNHIIRQANPAILLYKLL